METVHRTRHGGPPIIGAPRHARVARIAAWLTLGGVLLRGSVGSAASLTLADALARAAVGPAVRAAAAEVEAARGRLVQAGVLATNPVVTGDLARHANQPGGVNLDRGVDVSQEVEVGGQRGLRIDVGRADTARAEQLLVDRRRIVAAETRRAFVALAAAERRVELAAEEAALAGRLREVTRRRAHAGDVGGIDLQQAEIEAARADRTGALAELERARAEQRLAGLLGAGPEERLVTVAGPEPDPHPVEVESLVERALVARPDLLAARLERDRLDAAAAAGRRAALVPTPKIHVFYRQEQDVERIAGGAIELPLPLWDRGQGTAIADGAAVRAAAIEVERLESQIPRDVRVAAARRTAAATAWRQFRAEVLPAARDMGSALERSYGAGYLGLPDVLANRDRLIRARSDAVAAWVELVEAMADLDEAVGEEVR